MNTPDFSQGMSQLCFNLFSVSIDLMFVNNEEILLIPQTQTKDFFIDDIYELIYEYYGSNIEIENE